jgi:hypothetical protein
MHTKYELARIPCCPEDMPLLLLLALGILRVASAVPHADRHPLPCLPPMTEWAAI